MAPADAPEPHPDVQPVLAEMETFPPSHVLSPESARRLREQRVADVAPEPVGRVHDVEVSGPDDDVPIRVYEPEADGPHPVVVYFHGGGWVYGSLETHDGLCRALANELDGVVVSVDYRLAPEHPFPAGLEDCYAVTEWAAENAGVFGGDASRLVVAGDSAGGNLAAAVSLMARDLDGPDIAYQALIYPVTNNDLDTPSYRQNVDQYPASKRGLEWCWEHYLERDLDGFHPYASPLRANDFSELPPATVLTCELDGLRSEGIAYANRLEDAGVEATHRNYERMIHGFMTMLTEPDLAVAREAVADLADDIDAGLD
ncbi:MAG: alpha/beta hydrolase [Haloarculaceae archaeon]